MDQSTRVRVIEGWHPSQPGRVGYNLLVDDDWIGTFDSLDSAAREAARHVLPGSTPIRDRRVVLERYIHSGHE